MFFQPTFSATRYGEFNRSQFFHQSFTPNPFDSVVNKKTLLYIGMTAKVLSMHENEV